MHSEVMQIVSTNQLTATSGDVLWKVCNGGSNELESLVLLDGPELNARVAATLIAVCKFSIMDSCSDLYLSYAE